ncbi:MAG: hypothetical protein ACRCSG_07055 [Cellulosilyticaceae bacterium]
MIFNNILFPDNKKKEKQIHELNQQLDNLFSDYYIAWNGFAKQVSPNGELRKLNRSIKESTVYECLEEIDNATKELENMVINISEQIELNNLLEKAQYNLEYAHEKLQKVIMKHISMVGGSTIGIIVGVFIYRKYNYKLEKLEKKFRQVEEVYNLTFKDVINTVEKEIDKLAEKEISKENWSLAIEKNYFEKAKQEIKQHMENCLKNRKTQKATGNYVINRDYGEDEVLALLEREYEEQEQKWLKAFNEKIDIKMKKIAKEWAYHAQKVSPFKNNLIVNNKINSYKQNPTYIECMGSIDKLNAEKFAIKKNNILYKEPINPDILENALKEWKKENAIKKKMGKLGNKSSKEINKIIIRDAMRTINERENESNSENENENESNSENEIENENEIEIENEINEINKTNEINEINEINKINKMIIEQNCSKSGSGSGSVNVNESESESEIIRRYIGETPQHYKSVDFIEPKAIVMKRNIGVMAGSVVITGICILLIDLVISYIEEVGRGERLDLEIIQIKNLLSELTTIMKKESERFIELTQNLKDGVIWLDKENMIIIEKNIKLPKLIRMKDIKFI